jgi:purine-binding chemotaxis protein CheW
MEPMENSNANLTEYVTATIGGQLFGLPIRRVQDVFAPERVTRVPLAPPEIAGVLNLRGRIVTLIDLSRRLGLAADAAKGTGKESAKESGKESAMAIGVESRGESYGLMIDSVGEVLKLDDDAREANPINLDPALARVSAGIHRLDGQLLMVLDVDRVLDIAMRAHAA